MSYNNAYLMKPLVFNRPVFKSKTPVNYEGHHNEVSQYNTSHRGIALGEPLDTGKQHFEISYSYTPLAFLLQII